MAIEKGMTASIEDFIAQTLAALQYEGSAVFKAAEVWMHQLTSGAESFTAFSPFAFIAYWPADAAREGDFDLRQVLRFSVLIGAESKVDGIARRGDSTHVGISRIRDLVIDALDGVHPGDGFNCDELEFFSETEMVDTPKRYATELHFRCNWLNTSS